MVKLLMSWDIQPGKESDYFEFSLKEFGPGIIELGIQPTESWYTVVGNGPQILTGGIARDQTTLEQILASEGWQELKDKLLSYVTNFRYCFVPATGRFQLM